MRYYLAIDIGASSGRHIIAEIVDGKIVLEEVYRFWNGMDDVDVMVVDVPFGLIPLEIDEVYPLSQNDAPRIRDVDAICQVVRCFENNEDGSCS